MATILTALICLCLPAQVCIINRISKSEDTIYCKMVTWVKKVGHNKVPFDNRGFKYFIGCKAD